MLELRENTSSFYNRIAFLYPLIDIFLRPQKRMLFREMNQLPYGQLLEIGVGNGKHLSQYKNHKVTGIDTASKMLDIAKAQQQENTELLLMDGHHLGFPAESFDYVVLSHVIAVVENPNKMLEEIHRILKPGGKIFILNHFTPGNWLKHIDHLFRPASNLFHFRSVFYIDDLPSIKKFALQKEICFSLSYFKILIYRKA
jgi:phosphatidylethanolamine/phosphatidyl-N-methylethanolamine N-methyltransferase